MAGDETLIRLVRLTFKHDFIESFLELYKSHHDLLVKQAGFHSVILINDLDQPNVFLTLSLWRSKDHLERYRQSEVFSSTWSKIKPWFANPPVVQNLRQIDIPITKS